MQDRSLGDWLEYLESLHPKAIDLGLERVYSVAARLDLLEPDARVVTVAGTNGKGSTCAVLETLALGQGMGTGLYSSPHLLRYNERVRINGQPVSDAALVDAFGRVEAARGDVGLTYFEFGTLAALALFKLAGLDLLILEVGLGGRLDAVNIIDPDIAIITSIALDHESWLGDNREDIGREKAGILRRGIPAVLADTDPPDSVLERLAALDCQVLTVAEVSLPGQSYLPLRKENVAAAVGAAGLLGISCGPAELSRWLEQVSIPGRMQRVEVEGRSVVLDVGHNPAAVANLSAWLEYSVTGPRVALFAALADKNIHDMIRPCRTLFDGWYIPEIAGVPRALAANELAARVAAAGVPEAQVCSSVEDAWRQFRNDWPDATLVVFGSFHTVAGFMQLMEDERGRA